MNAEALFGSSGKSRFRNKFPYGSEKSEHSETIVIIVCHAVSYAARFFAMCVPHGGIFRCHQRIVAGWREINFGVEACP